MTDRAGGPPLGAFEFLLAGPGGEPINLWRTCTSHGLTELPPMRLDTASRMLEMTLPINAGRPRLIQIAGGRPGFGVVQILGPAPGPRIIERAAAAVRHVLRLDEPLAEFYALTAEDAELAWACTGAGRLIRSPTVFEDVIKTICTTNCSWALTRRMVTALVEHLGERAPGSPARGWIGRTFPTAAAMAEARPSFYRKVVRAGYRGRYLRTLARGVARGDVDLERLGRAPGTPGALPDDEVAERLLALPGVGPYAAAHIMTLLGRYSRLVFDSWTRPAFARLSGRRRQVTDRTIERRFRPYGRYAGLAFWLYLTRGWIEDPAPAPT
ncbi:MAG TPA: Fe-S cluster assembly protein HesB [bacterium]|nr:Fe-S cluster assembly protein HesB [bacterium]